MPFLERRRQREKWAEKIKERQENGATGNEERGKLQRKDKGQVYLWPVSGLSFSLFLKIVPIPAHRESNGPYLRPHRNIRESIWRY